MPSLSDFLCPKSIALVGATDDLRKFSGRVFARLQSFGYEGRLYPVNPGRDEVGGHRAYRDLRQVPEPIDHVGIAVPAEHVEDVLAGCVERGVRSATVFSAGFGEATGRNDRELWHRWQSGVLKGADLRVLGPNSNGFVNFFDRVALTSTATVAGPARPPGDIAVVAQSGGVGQVNVMWRAQHYGLNVGYEVSCGNSMDLDAMDFTEHFVRDERITAVLVIVEGLRDAERIYRVGRAAREMDKAVVVLKLGRTELGGASAASHTGAIAGERKTWEAVLEAAGCIQVSDTHELYETAQLVRRRNRRWSVRVGAVTISGGNAVLAADVGSEAGIVFPQISTSGPDSVQSFLPGFATAKNPLDLTPTGSESQTISKGVEYFLSRSDVDVVVPILTMTSNKTIDALIAADRVSAKPLCVVWTGGCVDGERSHESLREEGLPTFSDPSTCFESLARASWRGNWLTVPWPEQEAESPWSGAGAEELGRALRQVAHAGVIPQEDTTRLLRVAGFPMAPEVYCRDAREAAGAAAEFGCPVVAKIEVAGRAHRSRYGGVLLGLRSPDEVEQEVGRALGELRARGLAWRQVILQPDRGRGREVFLGCRWDDVAGPVGVVGAGGSDVEQARQVAVVALRRDKPWIRFKVGEICRHLGLGADQVSGSRWQEAIEEHFLRLLALGALIGPPLQSVDMNPLALYDDGRAEVLDGTLIMRAGSGD